VEIVKNVEGDDAPENSRFTFTIEVTDSKADSGDINNTNSDAWVWFSIYDSDGQLVTTVSLDDINFVTANNLRYELINGDDKSVVDEVDETNIAYYSGYCCVPSGTTITAKLPSGYKLDVINLPVDSVCIITEPEDEIPAGYSIEGIVETRTYHDEEDEEQEEPIQTTNTNTITVTIGYNESTYKVDVNNQWDRIDVTLKKVDADEVDEEPNNLLQGATFTVTKYTDSNFNHVDQDTPYTQTKADVKDGNTYTLNGSFEFTDLPIGYYKVEESVMPTGYVKTGDDPVFEVRQKSGSAAELEIVLWKKAANGTGYEEVEGGSTGILRIPNNTNTIIVGNTPGAALPNTGGPGTRLFTILGSILILGAGVLLWRRRRLI
jgi:LPXTG-motif cell wall-anchored protein